jgi:hypothetical protein
LYNHKIKAPSSAGKSGWTIISSKIKAPSSSSSAISKLHHHHQHYQSVIIISKIPSSTVIFIS